MTVTERLDPLVAGAGIEAAYKRYLKTMLAPRDPELAAAFTSTIDRSTQLTKGPLLELTPPYAAGASLADLISEGVLHTDFLSLASPKLPLDRPLYQHQERAIRKVVAGRNLVVSTGTGSGKTESFLLPILNSLIAERANGTLGPGVRALLLYPMNALANDQLKRLRGLLADTPDITFGRYTGETKSTPADASALYRAMNPGSPPLPNELLSRDEMRASPPHILLTNYAMLEYLLLRPDDIDLFDGGHADTWRFIALDEAHVYDGAQGSEVALLLRRLRDRVARGRSLQCIATSASLTGRTPETQGAEAVTFAENLFDVPFEYVDGDDDRQDLVTATRQAWRDAPSWTLDGDELLALAEDGADLDVLATRSGTRDPACALDAEHTIAALKSILSRGPVGIHDLQKSLWPQAENGERLLDALVSLGSKVHDTSGNPVLSARYHMFVRATEGAYVSYSDAGPAVLLGRHEVHPDTGRAVFEFGTCGRCGAVHLAGEVESIRGVQYFRPVRNEAAVKWLVVTDSDGDGVVDEDDVTLSDEKDADGSSATIRNLCTGCGVMGDGVCGTKDCLGGPALRVRQHSQKSLVMGQCTECGARARQVVRRLRTDVNAAPAVITTALYQHIPAAADETIEEVGEGRKLLMFSDSRQAAAFAAPYLDRTYSRLIQRRYLAQVLEDPKFADDELAVDDLANYAARKAKAAHYFPQSATRGQIDREVNPWAMAELMAMDHRQSLEGLGLMAVSLYRARSVQLPPGFAALGLTDEEAWALLSELLNTVRFQGAITLLDDVDIKAEIFEPRNTTVRIRTTDSDPAKRIISWMPGGRPGTTNNRILLVRKLLAALGSDEDEGQVLRGCWNFLEGNGYVVSIIDKFADGYQVDHTKMRIRSGIEVDWFECSSCRRLTVNNVRGVCPHGPCDGKLQAYTLPDIGVDQNHYRTLYRTMHPVPMSAEEHTAQWAAEKAAAVQKDFIDGKVNVLSCSTTFELGVDVGDLQSVVLRNMPPKTANYVQRAGRAGRRAASAALVLTYAKRSSHDLSKYQNPESMIAGEMRIPWIPIENERIGRRHAHSIALAAYFRHRYVADGLRWSRAGDFFTPDAEGVDSAGAQVEAFLTPPPPAVREALDAVIPASIAHDIGIADGSWVHRLVELLRIAETDIRNDLETFGALIEEAKDANNFGFANRLDKTMRTIRQRPLLGYLANKNVLPKYGFPVDTVELRTTHCEDPVGAQLELSRDLSQAIYDYAPGNEVVAGGRVWTSRGLHKLPKRELVERKYRVCRNCDQFQCATALDVSESCPSCHEQFGGVRTFVVPEFGFVADRTVRDVRPEPPARRWGGASYVEDIGDVVDTFTWASTGVQARAGTRARMAVISTGGGAGFNLCGLCGWADAAVSSRDRKKTHKRPATGKDCNGSTYLVSLAHRYETDVAEFTFDALQYEKDAENHWLSVLYAILEGASEALEISRDDIDGTLSWSVDGKRSIVIFDTVPAGAGAAKKIAENLQKVVQYAVDRVNRCDCGAETSCYGCLRSFRNDRHHEKLSRAGALDVFSKLKIEGAAVTGDCPWGQSTRHMSSSVAEILVALALQGVPEPQIGVDLGMHFWPVEAVWEAERVVLVEGDDAERDSALGSDGYSVIRAGSDAISSIPVALKRSDAMT